MGEGGRPTTQHIRLVGSGLRGWSRVLRPGYFIQTPVGCRARAVGAAVVVLSGLRQEGYFLVGVVLAGSQFLFFLMLLLIQAVGIHVLLGEWTPANQGVNISSSQPSMLQVSYSVGPVLLAAGYA